MLKKKLTFETNFRGGIIISEITEERGGHMLNLWYKISKDYCLISFIVGCKIVNDKKKTIKAEILRLIENGYLDHSIEILKAEESLE